MIQVVLGFATDLGERAGAWDEVYYDNSADLNTSIQLWRGTLDTVPIIRRTGLGVRLNALSDQCYTYYQRFSMVGTRGASQTFVRRDNGLRNSENFAGDAAVTRVFSATRVTHREIRMGGLPDDVVADNTIDPAFLKNYIVNGTSINPDSTTFIGWLARNAGIRGRTTTIGGGSSQLIVGAAKDGQYGLITIALAAPITFNVGDEVVIAVRGQPQIRGNWKIAARVDTTHYTLAGSSRVSCPPSFTGYMTAATFGYNPIEFWDSTYLSAHKLGKKKYQRRGRQSAKLLRTA